MADLELTFGRLHASIGRLERTMFVGLIIMSSVWWAGCAATGTLILASHRDAHRDAAAREALCHPKADTQLALSAHHNCDSDP